ncbi:CYTH domain-containing protein [Macrococcus sp. DPC7161]|uniref:CYTH domain-containing protein n=1 Tax=Macrococcus sp. DPC7161 TaxID=2507060 RepID=UPI00100AAE2C|nr:CYTH domain-containing protein [Macrococcus sp. DPC7161]RXK18765.1 CYTH domain-containing protein [Macrococcus sp. DPC7161]
MDKKALEIEFKNLLSYEQFDQLRQALFSDVEGFTQTNFYIDTPHFDLKNAKIALRIRDIGTQKEMTLKIPQQVGIMEYNGIVDESITIEEFIQTDKVPQHILDELTSRNIPIEQLKIFGALSTERYIKSYASGTLFLDASHYLDQSDFEIEYEVTDYEKGKQEFKALLETYNIQPTEVKNKVQRFYDRYQALIR